MKKIRMVDLQGQYEKIKGEVHRAMQEVIDTSAFIKGPAVQSFEKELAAYLDIPHVVACGNGTDALQVAMMALGLKPGDEVITTPFTFISTVEVIRLLGLRPVFVDVRPDTFNLDPDLLEQAITPRTRALVPVHLFGQCARMDDIMDIARRHGLKVIEDNAQAIGAAHTSAYGSTLPAGTIGDMGTTSFFPSKNLGAYGDGGALFTRDEETGQLLRSLVNHGMSRERYYYDHVGVNSRLDTLQAAILRVKLQHLDAYAAARQEAAAWYDRELGAIEGVQVPVRSSFSTHVFHQYTLQVPAEKRDGLKAHLAGQGIPSAVYYPVPLHKQRAYLDLGYGAGSLPVSEGLSTRVLSLPMHTELEEEQLDFICTHVTSYLKH
jgi:dTDP-4-amino-4,6-dideoxygalactose transaminase